MPTVHENTHEVKTLWVDEPFAPRGKFWGDIPDSVEAAPTLSPWAKLLLGRLYRFAGDRDYCFPTLDALAQKLGTSVATSRRATKELEDAGLIRTIRTRRGPAHRQLILAKMLVPDLRPPWSERAQLRNQESSPVSTLKKSRVLTGEVKSAHRRALVIKEEVVQEDVQYKNPPTPLAGGFESPPRAQARQPADPPSALAVRPTCSPRFPEWFQTLWAPRMGTQYATEAAKVWCAVVTIENADACFHCTASYIASRGSREYGLNGGFRPDNFLRRQAKNLFSGRWPEYITPGRKPSESEKMMEEAKRFLRVSTIAKEFGRR
jgi:hypothetical protein